MNRTTQFDKLIKISPCPVKISNKVADAYSGCFWWGRMGDIKPYQRPNFKPSIEINSYCKSQAQQIDVLLHEIGHAIHYRRHCRCYTDHSNRFLAEYHAEKFVLQFMLRYKLKGALRYEIKELNSMKTGLCSELWQSVIEQLQSEKIWQRCIEYLQ